MKKTIKKKNKIFITINNHIKNDFIRIVGDINPTEEITKTEALKISRTYDLDLILMSTTKNNVGICRIMEHKKYLYELKKKQKDAEKKQKENAQDIKELRFGPNTDEHDFNFKLKHAEEFLKRGDIVKAFVFFKGREIQFKEKGELLLLKLADALAEFGLADSAKPKLEGRRMIMFIRPKKK